MKTVVTTMNLAWQSARQAPASSGLLVLTSAVGIVATVLIPAALAHAINAAVRGHGLAAAVGQLAGILSLAAAADMTAGTTQAVCTTKATAKLRHAALDHALRRGIPGQDRFPAGDLTSRLVASTTDAGAMFPAAVSVASGVATACGGIVALWLIAWPLGVTFTVAVLPTALIVMTLLRRTTDLFGRYRQVQAMIASRLADALAGTRTIRAAGTTDQEVKRILAPLPTLSAAGYAMWRAQRRSVWQAALIAALAEMAVLAVAGIGVADGRINTGLFVAAAGYVALGLGLLDQIDSIVGIGYAAAGAERVAEFLDTPLARESIDHQPLGSGAGALALRDVTAKTANSVAVLEELNLDIAPGTLLAVVGRSGAGKSTLAHLLGRLREPDAGEVLIDEMPVSLVRRDSLPRAVAYAFERPALLGATVHEAIAFARPDLPREQVELAAEMAQADTFIARLPQGYDTPLSETPLSGGESQRLGLARAFAQDARVMVLDDATSSLDMVTELLVSQALTERLHGRTRVVVAHRASTAARADLVAWIDDGRLRSLATHDELWADPSYRAVFAEEALA